MTQKDAVKNTVDELYAKNPKFYTRAEIKPEVMRKYGGMFGGKTPYHTISTHLLNLKNEGLLLVELAKNGRESFAPANAVSNIPILDDENTKDDTMDTGAKIDRKKIPLNQILYGAPGTGKTYKTIIMALEIITGKPHDLPKDMEQRKKQYAKYLDEFNKLKKQGQIEFVTFHQSMSYEEFVEGIKPVMGDDNDDDNDKQSHFDDKQSDLQYRIEDGVFKKIVNKAKDNDKKYVLIIDEINRGNISKIFGELITLLEPTKRIGADETLETLYVTLPYSKKPFGVPANLYIIGTMNTSDRSIASLDIALRRRFSFRAMRPEDNLVKDVKNIQLNSIFKKMNKKIEILLDEDHMIGHSFLMKCQSVKDVRNAWFNEIMPLINEYFYGDWEKIKIVLGDFVIPIDDIPKDIKEYYKGETFYKFIEDNLDKLDNTEFVNKLNKLA